MKSESVGKDVAKELYGFDAVSDSGEAAVD
jgi:hypothetical protein